MSAACFGAPISYHGGQPQVRLPVPIPFYNPSIVWFLRLKITPALNEYLATLLPIVEEALQGSNRSVQAALYDGLLVFFDRIRVRLSEPDNAQPLHLGELEAPLTDLVNRLLLRDVDLTIEANRAKRARAAEGYIALCRQLGFPPTKALRQSIAAWLAQERSQPVRRTLNEISQQL